MQKQAQYQKKINVIWNYKKKKNQLNNQTLGIKMPLRCDHCLLHFTSQGITGWERNVPNMKNINALDQKTDSTEHLLFWCKVWWCYLVNCVLACHEVEGWGGGVFGFDLVASKWGGHQKPSISPGIKHVSVPAIIHRVTGGPRSDHQPGANRCTQSCRQRS